MNIDKLKQHAETLKEFIGTFDNSIIEDKFVVKELYKTAGAIRDKIWREEMDNRNKERLTYEMVSGKEIVVPYFMKGYGEDKYLKLINDELYVLPKEFKLDKDNSFHHWAYAYIKVAEDKHVVLTVRMLGGDRFGNRIFTESVYYKKPESNSAYYSKDYGKNNRFPEIFAIQVHNIIKEFNKLEGVENFNPLEKKE